VEDPSIFQRKDCLHCISGEWILMILSGNARRHKRRRRGIYAVHKLSCNKTRGARSGSSVEEDGLQAAGKKTSYNFSLARDPPAAVPLDAA
jgi:hypothetical protein